MKTKLTAPILLTVMCLLLVVGGTSHAWPLSDQQPIHQQTITNTVYLPIVSKQPCFYIPHVTMYASVNKPVVKVGEIVTFTGVLVNDCTPNGQPIYSMYTKQSGGLSPSLVMVYGYPPSVLYDSYQEITFTTQATGTGVVTVTVGVNYETRNPNGPPIYYHDIAAAAPIVMRVLP